MTKDGVRDFIAAEYTLSENYVHGLATFGPRLKKFRKPAFLPGLKPRASCGKFCEPSAEVKVSAQGDVGIKAKSAFHCISANALCAYSADTFNPIVH